MAYDSYKGVEITDTYFTGRASVILPTLTRSIDAIMRSDRQWKSFYLGIGSGLDYWMALTRRVDEYKVQSGVKRMYLMYESSSQQVVRSVESKLEKHYRELRSDDLLNRTGGGGGRKSAGPKFFLYLAVAP